MKKFHKILVVSIDESALDPESWEQLKEFSDEIIHASSFIEAKSHLLTTDCLLIGYGTQLDSTQLEALPALKYIGVFSTAHHYVDLAAIKKRGVIVTNIPGFSTESVAEFTIATILEHIRDLRQAQERAQQGNFTAIGLRQSELKGKIFGIVGLGEIGMRVAEIAHGFRAKVHYWSRSQKPIALEKGFQADDLEQLLTQSDFISINVAKTSETTELLSAERIALIKPGAVIVSTVSPSVFDADALLLRLKRDDLTFITMFTRETTSKQFEALTLNKNFIFYPLISASTIEARQQRQKIFLQNIASYVNNAPIHQVL